MANKHEFDEYIQDYRKTLDQALYLSGESSTFFAEYKAQKLAEWYGKKLPARPKILDFGCGDGLMAHFVKYYFPQADVYGIDPSQDSIEVAQEAYSHITFSSFYDDEPIPFANNSFDLIYAAGVFHHIPFEEHEHFLQELYRITKPGGYVVIMELNPLNPATVITFKRNPIDQNAHMMTPWYTAKLASKLGKVRTTFYCFFPNFVKKLRFLEPYMTKVPFGALYTTTIQKR